MGIRAPERLELLRVLEELLDLVQLLDCLVGTGHVAEGDLRRVDRQPLGARLAERHDLRAAALDLVHQEDPEADEDQERQDVGEQRQPAVALAALDVVVLDPLALLRRLQAGVEAVGGLGRIAGLVLLAVAQLDRERVVLGLHVDRADLPGLQLADEVPVGRRLRALARADELLCEERQHHDDQDRECGALEEPAHDDWTAPPAPRVLGTGKRESVPAFPGLPRRLIRLGARPRRYWINAATYGRFRYFSA